MLSNIINYATDYWETIADPRTLNNFGKGWNMENITQYFDLSDNYYPNNSHFHGGQTSIQAWHTYIYL